MPVRIIEKESGNGRRPIGQNAFQSPSPAQVMDAIIIGVEDAPTLQCTSPHNVLMVRDHRSFHAYLDPLASFLESPAMDGSAAGKTPVDADVPVQVGRGFRHPILFQVVG